MRYTANKFQTVYSSLFPFKKKIRWIKMKYSRNVLRMDMKFYFFFPPISNITQFWLIKSPFFLKPTQQKKKRKWHIQDLWQFLTELRRRKTALMLSLNHLEHLASLRTSAFVRKTIVSHKAFKCVLSEEDRNLWIITCLSHCLEKLRSGKMASSVIGATEIGLLLTTAS